jgi:hypothetical protein
MPNWCDNSVTLHHEDKSKVDALAAEMSKKNDDGHSMAEPFIHLRPRPADQEENWYDWNISNWGTKWEAGIIDWDRQDDNTIWISFDSAWSPPIALYEYLVEHGWEVNALYQEPGMGYAGTFTTEDGDDYYEYDISDPESIENLPEELIEFGNLREYARDYMINQIEEQWGDAERTDWIDAKVAPVRDGWYEIQTKGWEFPQFCEYKDGDWDNYNEVTMWRGLAEEPDETEVG